MLRIIFNDGIMERRPIEVLELPALEKLTSRVWRSINNRAMCMAALEAETGIVEVGICRVKDEDDPWYREGLICTPYGERICEGLASQRMEGVDMIWRLPGQRRSWTYRNGGGRNYYD